METLLPVGPITGLTKKQKMAKGKANHAENFKAKVALSAIVGDKTLAELALEFYWAKVSSPHCQIFLPASQNGNTATDLKKNGVIAIVITTAFNLLRAWER